MSCRGGPPWPPPRGDRTGAATEGRPYKDASMVLIAALLLFVTGVNAQRVPDRVRSEAQAFRLEDVRLLNGPFKHAMQRDAEYLLRLDPDRLLSAFRTESGLKPRAAPYGGWEAMTIAGHSLGHYLSACSMM